MRIHHRHSFFPLIIILLTLGLILFMFYALTFEEEQTTTTTSVITVEEEIPVDTETYRSDLVYVLAVFDDTYSTANDDLSKLVATESAIANLLDMKVPTEYKELHLELAVAFNQIQAGLRSSERSVDEPIGRLEQLYVQFPWLAQ